jgi:hypothetical protein
MKPLIPEKFVWLAAGIAGLATIAAGFVPPPWNVPVLLAGALSGFLAGQGAPQLSFAAGQPLVPITAVPILGSVSAGIAQYAVTLPQDGFLPHVLLLASGLLAWLAGKAMPQPKVVVAEAAGAQAAAAVDSKGAALRVIENGPQQ